MYDADLILAVLKAMDWPDEQRNHADNAAALAIAAYTGHVRDQGTPYLDHPLAVVTILRDELQVTNPQTLLLGLLHDALEVAPHCSHQITARLGRIFTEKLRAMTPDHRLEGRPKQASDDAAWRTKTESLDPDGLLIRFADRIHNLRDLRRSQNLSRRHRFITSLTEFYLPLAKASQAENAYLKAAYELLQTEYERYQTSTATRP